jgi:serine/threonine protein phosphatase 1
MLSGLMKRLRNTPPIPDPAPDMPVAIIGDIHGRSDLLRKALAANTVKTICVGDYIDRGEDSAGVLRHLQTRDDVTCLMGNHEEMLLNFLDDPARHGPRWMRYGGLQTLMSFGVTGASETSAAAALEMARDVLVEQMGDDLIAWLRARPNVYQSGNIVVTHAGADPARSIEDQDAQILRWGHPDFEKTARTDGNWIVHGHVIVDAPTQENGRINLDTGAYATGRLSAAHIANRQIAFKTFT